MARKSSEHSRRHLCRLIFLVLVIIPFIPTFAIWIIAVLAELKGCRLDQEDACLIGSLQVSDVIRWALEVGASFIVAGARKSATWLDWFLIAVSGWLVVCYIALLLGWARTLTRLLLGFAVALVFAILPYVGPMLAIASLQHDKCKPNDSYVGPCTIFGGNVGSPAHDAVNMGMSMDMGGLVWLGAPWALKIFVIYAIVVIVLGIASAKRRVASA